MITIIIPRHIERTTVIINQLEELNLNVHCHSYGDQIKKNTDIKIQVGLDENNIPEQMQWSAEDGGIKDQDTKAMLLSFWDSEQQEALKMDLWVKDMPVDQMQLFFYQTLMSLSDTFYKATQDEKMTATMRDFCDYFAEKLELKK